METKSYLVAFPLLIILIITVNSCVITDKYFNYNKTDVTELMKNHELFTRTRRTVVVLDKMKLWEGGIIPYHFDDVITGRQRRFIKKAMREWEKSTRIQFVERNEEIHPSHYLNFTKLALCECCYVEQELFNKVQQISLGDRCFVQYIVVHELGHAISFHHEHNHPDRDEFIQINYSNIPIDEFGDFKKYTHDQVDLLDLPYDYESVMHYHSTVLTNGHLPPTIKRIPKSQNGLLDLIKEKSKPSNGDIAATNLLYQCSSCGETLYEPRGTFEQPINNNNFTSNVERCEWRIRAAEGESIKLKIISLKIYQTYNCLLDYLEIRNGSSRKSPIIARYCGDIMNATITANNFLLVTYVKMSNQNILNSFKAEYETICHRTIDIRNNTFYNLESSNYPEPYKPYTKCYWYFIAPENHQVVIEFNFFEIEYSQNCDNDYIKIRNKIGNWTPIIGFYCGIMNTWKVNSTENKLYMVFSSNGLIEKGGFSATLTARPIMVKM